MSSPPNQLRACRRGWTDLPNTCFLCLLAISVAAAISASEEGREHSIALAGAWRFRLDPDNVGVAKKWFAEKLHDSVILPGTTDTNQKGAFKDEQAVDRLSRVSHFIRDVRRDLYAPNLPFVIGVLGVGGPTAEYGPDQQRYKATHQTSAHRKSSAASAKAWRRR